MTKFFKIVSPIFFWVSMALISTLSLFIIFINYKIIVINSAIAAEAVYISEPIGTLSQAVAAETNRELIDCDCEKRYDNPISVSWNGKVIASFVSGLDIGVVKDEENNQSGQFYVIGNGKYNGDLGGKVKVNGKLVGITCAYANSVFGECVPEVDAEEIISL